MLYDEMTDHLGYEKHATEGHHSGNSRNGTSLKKLKAEHGEMAVRSRATTTARLIPKSYGKGQTRLDGCFKRPSQATTFDQAGLALGNTHAKEALPHF
jgi:hypothetical protein